MTPLDATADAPRHSGEFDAPSERRLPGLVRLMDAGQPAVGALAVGPAGLELGRDSPPGFFTEDDWVSRRHVQVRRVAACWVCTERGSRNGTWVQGQRLEAGTTLEGPVVLRLGRSLCWLTGDVRAHLRFPLVYPENGPILGGAMRAVWEEIASVGRAADTLLVTGPSGAGKELAARAFHEAHYGANSKAPFVAVNCATIPHGLAERLLFGAKRGAYSGATQDARGLVEAAHEGTLFLDELAELDPLVQAKLLRVLETRELTPLGATRAQPVHLRICGATLKDLRTEVAAGRFREDLYYRLGRPEVCLPALSERLDELPWLAKRVLEEVDLRLKPSVGLIERCALRAWPGNVRELIGELRRAAFKALSGDELEVGSRHLAPDAGQALQAASSADAPSRSGGWPGDEEILAALERHGGNVSGTAKALGLHRNQLRRWLDKRGDGSR